MWEVKVVKVRLLQRLEGIRVVLHHAMLAMKMHSLHDNKRATCCIKFKTAHWWVEREKYRFMKLTKLAAARVICVLLPVPFSAAP